MLRSLFTNLFILIVINLAETIAQFAKNEQNMNAVERMLHYSELPPEGDAVTPYDPPASWPHEGQIKFDHVELAYREGLPLVLKDVSFGVRPGEKVITLLASWLTGTYTERLDRDRGAYWRW